MHQPTRLYCSLRSQLYASVNGLLETSNYQQKNDEHSTFPASSHFNLALISLVVDEVYVLGSFVE